MIWDGKQRWKQNEIQVIQCFSESEDHDEAEAEEEEEEECMKDIEAEQATVRTPPIHVLCFSYVGRDVMTYFDSLTHSEYSTLLYSTHTHTH